AVLVDRFLLTTDVVHWLFSLNTLGNRRMKTLLVGPLIIPAALNNVHFLPLVLTNITGPHLPRHRIFLNTLRIPQPNRPKLCQRDAVGINEWIVIRNKVVRRVIVLGETTWEILFRLRLATDWMTA